MPLPGIACFSKHPLDCFVTCPSLRVLGTPLFFFFCITDAAARCAQLYPGATLAYVRNRAENYMLLQLIERSHGVNQGGFTWMGTFRSRTLGGYSIPQGEFTWMGTFRSRTLGEYSASQRGFMWMGTFRSRTLGQYSASQGGFMCTCCPHSGPCASPSSPV